MNLHEKYGLTRIINANGKMTALSNARCLPEVVEEAAAALYHFFDVEELQTVASRRIAAFSGAEAGFVTACASAGLTLSVAAAMTGCDAAKVAQLPDTTGMKNEVVLQKGHAVNFGAPVTQMIRLAGARPVEVGGANGTTASLLAAAIHAGTAAVMFVVSHHTIRFGCVPLEDVVQMAHARGVPVIVDAAAQSFMLRDIVATGADLVVCSGHKYLAGTVAGLVCGRQELIRAVALQNGGIGRPMKVGKEGIFGLFAALAARQRLDVAEWAGQVRARVDAVCAGLAGLPGIRTEVVDDPNGNPFCRARVWVDPAGSALDAATVARLAAAHDPSVRVRPHHVDEGYFDVDVVELTSAELDTVVAVLQGILAAGSDQKAGWRRTAPVDPRLSWLRSRS